MSFLQLAGRARSGRSRAPPPKPPRITASPSPEVDLKDEDDEWYDCSSEDEASPSKKTRADNEHSLVSFEPITAEEEARLLPYMPALFGKSLPPCGLKIQVAYERINGRLRNRWLLHRGKASALNLIQAVKCELDAEFARYPPMSPRLTKARRPWRREDVFEAELAWIAYFLREASFTDLMTESELINRAKQSPVPYELGFTINREDIVKLWNDWNDEKRAPTSPMPEEVKVNEQPAEYNTISRGDDAGRDTKKAEETTPDSSEVSIASPTSNSTGADDETRCD